MKPLPSSSSRRGIVIFEVLAAILIFGLAAVSLLRAITVSAQTAVIAQQELRMILRLQSKLNEVSKYPRIEDLYNEKPSGSDNPDQLGIWTEYAITLIENVTTEIDGQPVNDMYHIKVTASYEDFGKVHTYAAETVRYARLYSTQGGAGGGIATPTPPR
jgi:hypothetical protein